MTPVIVIMGVAGSGKTTVATALARRLGWDELDGDDLHSPAAIAKMAGGVALTDDDRAPWLARIVEWIIRQQSRARPGVITCSALRRRYRDELRHPGVEVVMLDADRDTVAARLAERTAHFMPLSLLDSQLKTLEWPTPDENVLVVGAAEPVEHIVDRIVAGLSLDRWEAD